MRRALAFIATRAVAYGSNRADRSADAPTAFLVNQQGCGDSRHRAPA